MIVPTRRFWVLVALGIPLASVGAFVPGAEAVLIPYNLLLLLLLLGTSRLVPGAKALVVRRRFDPVLSVRVSNRIELEIANEGALTAVGRLRDAPPPVFATDVDEFEFDLEPGATRTIAYHAIPSQRGAEYFRGTFVRFTAPLGLAEVERRLSNEQPVRVYPNVLALREFDLLRQKGSLSLIGVRKSRIRGRGTEFESLRDYNEDDFRRIDWKSTARTGKLLVRNYEVERNQAVIVCLDVGRTMLSEIDGTSKLDFALDACLMLLHAASVSGDQVGLLVFGDTVRRYIPPRKGLRQSGVILDTVHGLQAEPVQPNYAAAFGYLASRWKRRALVVVFTDAENDDQASELASALGSIRRRHLLMVARVSDPQVKEMAGVALSEPEDLFKKSAGLWYQKERRAAEARLVGSGVQSIDAEPGGLSAALVSAYLVAKETGAL